MTSLAEKFAEIGLPKREAEVYIAALELGPTGALQIARRTGMTRPTVYDAIEALKKRGLMEVRLYGLKSKFAAADPDQFDAIISGHKLKFETMLPELKALYNLEGAKSQTKYYEGFNGIKTVYEMILRDIRSGDPYYVIGDKDSWDKSGETKWLDDFIERRGRRRLDARVILPDTPKNRAGLAREKIFQQNVRLMREPIGTDILVTPQRYVIHNFAPPVTAVAIENKDIIESQLKLFRYIWDTLPE